MMKRLMSLVLALMLVLSAAACAESGVGDKISNALYRIVLRTEEGDVSLGSATLFLENTILLTSSTCCAEGDLYAVGADGEHQILAWEKAKDTGVALMELATPSAGEPLSFASPDTQTLPLIFGVTVDGDIGSVPLTNALNTIYQGKEAVAFVGGDGLMPGGVAIDVEGGIMGLVVARQTEGQGMYIALDPDGLYDALMDASSVDQFIAVTLEWQDGILQAQWEDEERPGGSYAISLTGDDNVYYTVYGEEVDKRSSKFIVPAGHTYHVQVQWVEEGEEAPEPEWSGMTSIEVPATPFTEYGFRQECALTWHTSGTSVSEPVGESVSQAQIGARTEELYLRIACSYDLEQEIELPMAVELCTPDGQFYFTSMGYILAPEYEEDDVIFISVSELFTECMGFSNGELPQGVYTLGYDIQGQRGGECTFTVTEETSAQTASADSGFVTGLSVNEDKGAIAVSWADADLPEGANVTAFCLYNGNNYYTYQPYTDGETEAEFFSIPGRGVVIWAVWSMDEEVQHAVPQEQHEFVSVAPTAEEPFTDNGFTNLHIGVVPSKDLAAAMRNQLLPLVPITRDALNDPDTLMYFQTRDSYQVSETTSNHPLALVLCTPDGQCFVEYGSYIFDKSLQASDMWLRDITALFESHKSFAAGEAWPAGEYRVLYCIDGQIAGEYNFTLE